MIEHLVPALGGLLAPQDHHAAGKLGAVEKVRRQADDRLDQVLLAAVRRM